MIDNYDQFRDHPHRLYVTISPVAVIDDEGRGLWLEHLTHTGEIILAAVTPEPKARVLGRDLSANELARYFPFGEAPEQEVSAKELLQDMSQFNLARQKGLHMDDQARIHPNGIQNGGPAPAANPRAMYAS